MLFKACPKCHGDLYVDRDRYGAYIQCFQCGMTRDITAAMEAKRTLALNAKLQAA